MVPMKVFLSYATRDFKLARRVRERLEAVGFEVWDPELMIHPGRNWARQVAKALDEADALVVLLSPAGLSSDQVRRDIEYALTQIRFKGRLLPVIVRPVAEIPWILETMKVVRIEADPKSGSRRVAKVLKRLTNAA